MSTCQPSAAGRPDEGDAQVGRDLDRDQRPRRRARPELDPGEHGRGRPGRLHRARRQPGEVGEAEQPPLVAEAEPDRVAVDEHVGGVRVALGERQHGPEPLAEHRLGDGAGVVAPLSRSAPHGGDARPGCRRRGTRRARRSTKPSASKQESSEDLRVRPRPFVSHVDDAASASVIIATARHPPRESRTRCRSRWTGERRPDGAPRAGPALRRPPIRHRARLRGRRGRAPPPPGRRPRRPPPLPPTAPTPFAASDPTRAKVENPSTPGAPTIRPAMR